MNRPFMFRVIDNGQVVKFFRTLDRAISYIELQNRQLDLFDYKHNFKIYDEFRKDYISID